MDTASRGWTFGEVYLESIYMSHKSTRNCRDSHASENCAQYRAQRKRGALRSTSVWSLAVVIAWMSVKGSDSGDLAFVMFRTGKFDQKNK
jgi:hypothetical protein